ncbi:hypothetical protein DFH09DRAFT_1110895 [Mycena vulgaris]|nr:hypothetical protein DFH09DRAFT_1110895 [Mycena vulgaris]
MSFGLPRRFLSLKEGTYDGTNEGDGRGPRGGATTFSVGTLSNPENNIAARGKVPTRIPQALLGCVLACGILTAITVGQTHGVLTKAPYAIEKTRSRLADGAFVRARGAALSETGGGLGSAAGTVHIPAEVGE